MVGNLVLRRRVSGAVNVISERKSGYTFPNEILNMIIPILMHYEHFPFKKTVKIYFVAPIHPAAASWINPLASCIYSLINQCKTTLRNDVGFATVYRRIYYRKFMTLSHQTPRCICKCIRMLLIL